MQRFRAIQRALAGSTAYYQSLRGHVQVLARSTRTNVAQLRRQFASQSSSGPEGAKTRSIPWVAIIVGGTGALIAYNAWEPDMVSSYDEVSSGRKKRVVVLGSGWGAAALLKHLDRSQFEITCVSPRNYFLMTPLLPSVTVGTVETRTVVEPIRKLVGPGVKFLEAEAIAVDPTKKSVTCVLPTGQNEPAAAAPKPPTEVSKASGGWFGRKAPAEAKAASSSSSSSGESLVKSSSRTVKDSARTRPPFDLEYDVLIMAVGAENNTFGTPGVTEHAHFLKELPDAQRIRHAISDCFESAVVPTQDPEERKRLLHFVVVGGGPTGVEFAAELADFLKQDLKHYFGRIAVEEAKVTLIEAMDHVLSMMDRKISDMTEKQFASSNIELLANTFVKGVGQKEVRIQRKGSKEVESIPCALVVWATGIKPRDFANRVRKSIGLETQNNFRGILTDGFLSVKGVDHGSMFALGDCATIEQPKLLAQVEQLFKEAAKVAPLDPSHQTVTLDDLRDLVNRKLRYYPQLLFLMDSIEKNFADADINKDGTLDLEEFHKLLENADHKIRALPATAQVANQQGLYLAKLLNQCKGGPITDEAKPFRYRHLGSLAYIGGDAAVADFTGAKLFDVLEVGPMGGWGTYLFWRSFYLSEMFTLRTKLLLASDWFRTHVFGRDISRY